MRRNAFLLVGGGILAIAASAMSTAPAAATVLIFEGSTFPSQPVENPDPLEGAPVDQGYGDRVTATTDPVGDYLEGFGWTPNVVAEYGPIVEPGQWPVMWRFDFGDLVNVIYMPEVTGNMLTVLLAADPGYNVRLHAFDLGGWPRVDYTINSVTVTQVAGGDVELFREDNALVHGESAPLHTSYSFDPALQGQILLIKIDGSNLGAASENIGIDNISFSQVLIPEPASVVLWAIGLVTCCGALARGRRQ